MLLLVILILIVYFYRVYEPSIDITRERDVLLYYNWEHSRKWIKLFRI